eukprot:CAMPEP_0174265314 /NCGR_PEP_ID=MMETSP0439-20130205/26059_1 /TAXON_ID=0 /ORGANISM="Stereomyxa ramosa, Strain Chinc5" /LENGTH=546 /DNA_ID=CAMNT_0015351719 /DNA_START=1 /DNA_END=1641 /DNA_ORIENTATION=+
MRYYSVSFFFFFQLSFFCVFSSVGTVVNTKYGPVRGVINEDGEAQFLGVPFAAPPVGELRWKAPQAPTPWSDPIKTTQFGPACAQAPNFLVPPDVKFSEDCLTLNVWSPSNASTQNLLPVLFWIYGGGFISGGTSFYPGHLLAKNTNSIVVSVNYRLSFFGFWTSKELMEESSDLNFGLMDQQFGLQWVQDNIKNFGGDPSNVLIFGESAGGGSVSFHLTLPDSYPYYNKVLLESPGEWIYPNLTKQLATSQLMISNTVCSSLPKDQVIACLREMPSGDLLSAWYDFANTAIPIIDGVMVKETPAAAFSNGHFNTHVPAIIGSNFFEGLLFTYIYLIQYYGNASDTITENQFVEVLELSGITDTIPLEKLKSWYPASNGNERYLQASRIQGDVIIDCGTVIVAQSLYKYSEETHWRYLFTHNTTDKSNPFNLLGATHSSEVVYVFGATEAFNTTFTASEQELSDNIQGFITNFHRCGNPNSCDGNSKSKSRDVPSWPEFKGEAANTTFIWDIGFGTTGGWRVEYCDLISPFLINPNNAPNPLAIFL